MCPSGLKFVSLAHSFVYLIVTRSMNPLQAQEAYFAAKDRLKAAQEMEEVDDIELLQAMVQQRKQDYLGSVAASEHGRVKVAEADAAVQQAEAHAATRRLEIKEKYQREVQTRQLRIAADLEKQAKKEAAAAKKKQKTIPVFNMSEELEAVTEV